MAPDEIFDVIVVGGGPAGATAAHDLAGRGLQGRAARPGGPHQTLRRRDPAAPHPRLRHPRAPPQGARLPRDDGVAEGRQRRHADRRRFCRHGRPRGVRRMAARSRGAAPARRGSPASSRSSRARRRRPAARPFHAEGCERRVCRGAAAEGPHRHRRRRRELRDRAHGGPRLETREIRLRLSRDHRGARRQGRPARRTTVARSITAERLSPDFYAWIFPHGATMSVGSGSAHKGFSLKGSVQRAPRRDRPRQHSQRSAAKALRSRSSRCPAGTTAGTWCSPATRRASSRRPPAKASTTRCSAAASQPRRPSGRSRPATRARSRSRASAS